MLLLRLDRLRMQPTLTRFWNAVEGIVKEDGYASPRLGNFSRGLAYTDQCIEVSSWHSRLRPQKPHSRPQKPHNYACLVRFFFGVSEQNVMAYDHPEWFTRLPEKYNWRVWSGEGMVGVHDMKGGVMGQRYRPDVPCMHHFSASGMVSTFAELWLVVFLEMIPIVDVFCYTRSR
jgi:hypothetical protein